LTPGDNTKAAFLPWWRYGCSQLKTKSITIHDKYFPELTVPDENYAQIDGAAGVLSPLPPKKTNDFTTLI